MFQLQTCRFAALVAIFTIAWSAPARADFLFAFSGGDPVLLQVTVSGGGTVTLSTADSEFIPGSPNTGWWSDESANASDNSSYFVGQIEGFADYRNFFSFDTSSLTGQTVVAATLEIPQGAGSGVLGESPVRENLYNLFAVSTDAATLNNTDLLLTPNLAIFADLGDGTAYGKYSLSNGLLFDTFSLLLNADAVADLNTAIGNGDFFSVGGTLTVPEPGTVTLAGIGLLLSGVNWLRRRTAV